jgi:protein TonB
MLLATSEVLTARSYAGRFLMPVILAAIVTLLCLAVMERLIATRSTAIQVDMIPVSAPVVAIDLVEKPRELRPKPIKVMPSEPPVSVDSEQAFDRPKVRSVIGQITQNTSLADLINEQVDQFQFSAPVTDLIPVMVVNPVYPFGAQVRGIEGEVLVEFSVGIDGRVINPWIVEADPADVFDKAALRAIQDFRFRPPRLDGESFPVSRTRLKFYFRLEDLLKGISLSMPEESTSLDHTY